MQELVVDGKRLCEARAEALQQAMLTASDLEILRARVDEALGGTSFCDGCGFCCISNVNMTWLEFKRIEELVAVKPDLLQHQGLVCPFLDMDQERFNRTLDIYGKRREKLESLPCRIYHERPLFCRIFPAPRSTKCRDQDSLDAPDIVRTLAQKDSENFPELLIQKYYLTLRWESYEPPEDVLDPEVRFQMVPGWRLHREERTLSSHAAPHWLQAYVPIPDAFPVPVSCELEDWAVAVMADLETPVSYRSLLLKHSDNVPVPELGMLLAQAELTRVIVPVDFPLRSRSHPRSYWDWKTCP